MPYWIDHRAHELRLQDLRGDVEQRRLILALKTGRSRPARFYGPALASLGRRLVVWGAHLQALYSPIVEVSRG